MLNQEQIVQFCSQNKVFVLIAAIIVLVICFKALRWGYDMLSPRRRRCRAAGYRYGQWVTVRMTHDNWNDTWRGIVVDAERFGSGWLIHYRHNGSANDIRDAGDWLVS